MVNCYSSVVSVQRLEFQQPEPASCLVICWSAEVAAAVRT